MAHPVVVVAIILGGREKQSVKCRLEIKDFDRQSHDFAKDPGNGRAWEKGERGRRAGGFLRIARGNPRLLTMTIHGPVTALVTGQGIWAIRAFRPAG